jgi:PKD repeat protein
MELGIGQEVGMMRRRNVCLGVVILFGALTLLFGCTRFSGEVDFTATPTSGRAPLTVSFAPSVCGAIDRYVWSFGDGGTSVEARPQHTYAQAGNYSVTLLITPRGEAPIACAKANLVTVTSGMQSGRITPIYWTEQGKSNVRRCLRDGSLVQDLDMWIDGPADVAVAGSFVYWVDQVRGEISKHDLSTSLNTVLATDRDLPYGVAVNVQAGKLYWTEQYPNAAGVDGMVMQIRLDGSGAGTLRQTLGPAFDMAYDPSRNRLYWSQHFSVLPRDLGSQGYGISVQDLASGTLSRVVSGLGYVPYGIAIDSVNGRLYWTGGGAVHCCNLDGSQVETIVTGADDPRGIAIDPDLGKIYWGEDGKIRSANLDGSGAMDVLTGLGQVIGLALG